MNGDGAPVGAQSGHQTSRISLASLPLVLHVQVTAYRRVPHALLSTLRRAHEVGGHEPFTGPLMPNSARIILRLLRSQGYKRRSPNKCPINAGLKACRGHKVRYAQHAITIVWIAAAVLTGGG